MGTRGPVEQLLWALSVRETEAWPSTELFVARRPQPATSPHKVGPTAEGSGAASAGNQGSGEALVQVAFTPQKSL